MIRKQVYIDDDLDQALRALAARTGRSEAAHLRDALRAYLSAVAPPREAGGLEAMVGLVDDPDGPADVAEEHDHYLYGAPRRTRGVGRARRGIAGRAAGRAGAPGR
jgi:plasmid stability protein